MKTGKRLYEMGGDITNDFFSTGTVGSNDSQTGNSMLENNSASDALSDRPKRRRRGSPYRSGTGGGRGGGRVGGCARRH
jgi:hypothetical protein